MVQYHVSIQTQTQTQMKMQTEKGTEKKVCLIEAIVGIISNYGEHMGHSEKKSAKDKVINPAAVGFYCFLLFFYFQHKSNWYWFRCSYLINN